MNIAGTVDVPSVAEYAKTIPDVVSLKKTATPALTRDKKKSEKQ